jgi:hypothetical protein
VLFSIHGGGQTEWRWVGRGGDGGWCCRAGAPKKQKLTVNCKKTFCKKYFIILIDHIKKKSIFAALYFIVYQNRRK